jgi:hypothetical protein
VFQPVWEVQYLPCKKRKKIRLQKI